MRPIFLIGFMGSGKTTLGRALEQTTPLKFIDLDDYVESRLGMTVSECFANYGQQRFREAERDALVAVSSMDDVVIGCGGGTPCFFDNMEYMNSHGTTVWLDASLERLYERLSVAMDHRPLLRGKLPKELRDYIADSMQERTPYYSRSHYMLASDLLENPREIASTLTQFLCLLDLRHLL